MSGQYELITQWKNRSRVMSKAIIVILFLLSMASCKSDVTLSLGKTNRPTFKFERNFSHVDRVHLFIVEEIAPENQQVPYLQQSYDKNRTVWRIKADSADAGVIKTLDTITYGKIPKGWVQEIPADGPAPNLEKGKIYEAGGPYVTMSQARVRFLVTDDGVELLPIPSPR